MSPSALAKDLTPYTCFSLTVQAGVAHLELSRPDQMNSMNQAFWSELPRALDDLEDTQSVRALVISSTGAHFCSGMDLAVFQNNPALATDTAIDRHAFRRLVLHVQSVFTRFEALPFPVIAAIQGGCIGGAVDMVSACDMRYATQDAFFTIQEINIGIMADMGTLQRLPKLMPEGVVRELAFTGDRLSAERAQALGLVNQVYASQEEMLHAVMKVAAKIAAQSPLAVSASKEAINYVRDHSVGDALVRAADWQSSIFDTKAIAECGKARKEKRNAVHADLRPGKVSL